MAKNQKNDRMMKLWLWFRKTDGNVWFLAFAAVWLAERLLFPTPGPVQIFGDVLMAVAIVLTIVKLMISKGSKRRK